MLIALIIEGLVGWPDRLHAHIGHPVAWLGALIETLEQRWNTPQRSHAIRLRNGAATVLVTLAAALLPALLLTALLPAGWAGTALTALLAAPLVAGRSLHEHVEQVAGRLAHDDLAAARQAVTMLVSRDPGDLDSAGVARAALESLAENTSDAVVAPLFWGVIFGLPGIAGYKAINTLDSMIGYRNARYAHFGRVAARLDDVANLLPARLTGLLLCLVAAPPRPALRVMLRDARQHRSPNAGWPEAAMAGALGVRLSGPRTYDATRSDEPWLNAAAPDPDAPSLARGLATYRRALLLLGAVLAALAAVA
jgi:adenosylcobinamide-phosphate synthase